MPFCVELRSRGVVFVTLFMILLFLSTPAADHNELRTITRVLRVIGPVLVRTSGRASGDSE